MSRFGFVSVLLRAATLTLVALCLAMSGARGEVPVKVSGLGWINNREMRLALERLMGAEKADVLDANAIEDGAVILNSALNQQGFQQPQIDILVTLADGSLKRMRFDPTFMNPVPRPMQARALRFEVRRGVRWRIEDVSIEGLTVIPVDQGEEYFKSDATLLTVARTNAYSRSQLNSSENALLDELRRRGYAEATVRADVAEVDEKTGKVTVQVLVREGARWVIDDVQISGTDAAGVTVPDMTHWQETTWTPTIDQDIREAVRLAFYRGGYPDVGIHVETEPGERYDGRRAASIYVTVVPGARVTMGHARFEGNEKTREAVLRRRVRIQPGEPLNPIDIERARHRISRLGVFDSVDVRYEPPDGTTRNPVFELEEGTDYETSLLFGYGSYEQLRGGFEYRQMNIFGLAHQSRLLVIQSMKSTRGEYTYTVPELFGETIDGAAKLYGLQRKEIAFMRQEYGAVFSLRRAIAPIRGEAMVGYTFEALRNRENLLGTVATDEKQLNVASLTVGLTSDFRDNPFRPRRGFHAFTQFELASPFLGGVAQYQRGEIGSSYHTSWGRGRWIHLGLTHGIITTLGATDDRHLPVNKRFFPGGDNSIRGYQLGEAAPRGPDGRFVGAKSYLLLNMEFEQALTQSWSVVAFADALGNATALREYPFRERLYSVGLGLRYHTIVGPIRLEYGRNIHPRRDDPRGTWQLSIGYPF